MQARVLVAIGVTLCACKHTETPRPEPTSDASAAVSSAAARRPPEPPTASASASAEPAASAPEQAPEAPRLSPDGCPLPGSSMFPVGLEAPLGPALLVVKTPPPRCYPSRIEFGRYMNPRYALAADVPRFLEKYGEEGGNGDGASFSLGPEATLIVAGAHNLTLTIDPETMTEEKSREMALEEARKTEPGERLLGAVREGNAILRVSLKNGRRKMSKTIYEDRLRASVFIDYDESLKAYFEPIEQRLRDSLRTTPGGMYNRPTKPNRRYPKD